MRRDLADRAGGERIEELLELGQAVDGRAGAVGLVEDDEAAVLQVVDPLLGEDRVGRLEDPRR